MTPLWEVKVRMKLRKFFGNKDELKKCVKNLDKVKNTKWHKTVAIAIFAGTVTLGSIGNVYAYSSEVTKQQDTYTQENESDDIAQEWYVTTPEGEKWLSKNLWWLETDAGRHWLQEDGSCSWLLKKAGQNWLKDAGKKWLKEKEDNSVKMIKEKDGSLKWVTRYETSKGIESSTWKECLKVTPQQSGNNTYNNDRKNNKERGGR